MDGRLWQFGSSFTIYCFYLCSFAKQSYTFCHNHVAWAAKPLSTMYSCPPFTRVTCTGADCAFPSTTLYANTLSCTQMWQLAGMYQCTRFFCRTITLPAPPLCNNPSRLGNTARRLTVPVFRSITPLIVSIRPCCG